MPPLVISRRELLIWVTGGVLALHFLQTLDLMSFGGLVLSLASVNLIYCFAGYAVVHHLLKSDAGIQASRHETVIALFTILAIVAISQFANAYALGLISTPLAIVLILRYRDDPHLLAAGVILAAISVHLLWARLLFIFLLPALLKADAAAVNLWLSLVNSGVTQVGQKFIAPDGHAISLIGACSSFHNVSIAVLAYIAVIMRLRGHWLRNDYFWLATIACVMIVINVLRIGAFAWSADAYVYWHENAGKNWLGLIETTVLLGFSFLASGTGKLR